ncbi:hypothetical protein APMS7_07435 [Acinetobacter pittii]|nr:hypothetical protein APMS7_07435 [Acinetobacter pittii]
MLGATHFKKLEDGTGYVITLWTVDTIAKGSDCAAKVDAWIEIRKPSGEGFLSFFIYLILYYFLLL